MNADNLNNWNHQTKIERINEELQSGIQFLFDLKDKISDGEYIKLCNIFKKINDINNEEKINEEQIASDEHVARQINDEHENYNDINEMSWQLYSLREYNNRRLMRSIIEAIFADNINNNIDIDIENSINRERINDRRNNRDNL